MLRILTILFFSILFTVNVKAQPFNKYISFDGIDDYVKARSGSFLFPPNSDMTIEFYFRSCEMHLWPNYASIIGLHSGFNFHIRNGNLILFARDHFNSHVYATIDSVKLSQWSHIAIQYDDSQSGYDVYVDGVRKKSASSHSFSFPDLRGKSIYFGANASTGPVSELFGGYMDELRISDTLRYAGTSFTPPTTPFTPDNATKAIYHFDSVPTTDTIFNSVSGGFHDYLIVNGSPSFLNATAAVQVSQNADTLLTTNTYNSYQWVNCVTGLPVANDTNRYFRPSMSGNYRVIVYSGDCFEVSTCFSYISTSVQDVLQKEGNYSIWNDESTKQIRIHTSETEAYQLDVFSLNGSILFSKQLSGNYSFYPPTQTGIYLVRIKTDSELVSQKIVVR